MPTPRCSGRAEKHLRRVDEEKMTKYEIRYLNFLYLFVSARISDFDRARTKKKRKKLCRQISIMMARFVVGESLRQIAKDYGVCFEAARQTIKNGCRRVMRFPKTRKIILSLNKK